jgi:hypothetical protein
MGIGVDKLFGGVRCTLGPARKHKGYWYVSFNVDGGRGTGSRRFKRKPTRAQRAKIRREVCG